ncbi:MAG TPA: cytochrome C [Nitrospirae bacterium]|nr:cytochrome C [Nitrospirota bacterium]
MRRWVFIVLLVLVMATPLHADFRDLFQRQFIDKPWGGAPIVREGVCVDCHTSKIMNPDYLKIPQEWKMSIHYKNKVSCHDCHGGDPNDAAVSCGTPHSGFIGTPKYREVPELCGRCHVGILKNYLTSGHGKALKTTGKGPNCVTCHGAHNTQKASIDIINDVRCTKCHSYERARIMKQALFSTEKKISELDSIMTSMRKSGALVEDLEKRLFRTTAEFRTIFHTVDVNLVKAKTDEYLNKLGLIEKDLLSLVNEYKFRRNFSAFLLVLFTALGIITYIRQKF